MATSKYDESILTISMNFVKWNYLIVYDWLSSFLEVSSILQIDRSQAFDDKIILGESTCLVETADVDLASIWNTEWLCAEDDLFHECQDRVINSQRELHRKLWWHNVCDDKNAAE